MVDPLAAFLGALTAGSEVEQPRIKPALGQQGVDITDGGLT